MNIRKKLCIDNLIEEISTRIWNMNKKHQSFYEKFDIEFITSYLEDSYIQKQIKENAGIVTKAEYDYPVNKGNELNSIIADTGWSFHDMHLDFKNEEFQKMFFSLCKRIGFNNFKFTNCKFKGDFRHPFVSTIWDFKQCEFDSYIIDNQNKLEKEKVSLTFQDCEFKNLKSKNIIFDRKVFVNTILSKKNKKINTLELTTCVFKKDFILTTGIRNSISSIYHIKEIKLNQSIFEKKVKIQFCNITDTANFYNTKFKDLADFYQTTFNKNVNFERTDFFDISVFSEAIFNCDVDFKYTKFLKQAIFRDTVITGILDLRNTIFDSVANFLDITSQKRVKKEKEFIGKTTDIKVANRETARVIKNFFDNSNNIIEANKFYKLEMVKREEELSLLKNPLEWLIFKIHRVSSNHSQNWILPLFWILNISFGYIIAEQNLCIYKSTLISWILFIGIVISGSIIILKMKDTIQVLCLCLLTYFIYYSYVASIDPDSLNSLSKLISPLVKITTFWTLIYKITIGYLIYQLIISIRQNTRRK